MPSIPRCQYETVQTKIYPFVKIVNLAQIKLLIKILNYFRLEEAEYKIDNQGACFYAQSNKYYPGNNIQCLKYEAITF
jgi:hypothetical protein